MGKFFNADTALQSGNIKIENSIFTNDTKGLLGKNTSTAITRDGSSPAWSVTSPEKGLQVVNIKNMMDPKKSGEEDSLFSLLQKGDKVAFLEKLLKPLDGYMDKVNSIPLVKMLLKDTDSLTLSQRLAQKYGASEDGIDINTKWDMTGWIKEADEKYIASNFPFIKGMTPIILERFMMPYKKYAEVDEKTGNVKWGIDEVARLKNREINNELTSGQYSDVLVAQEPNVILPRNYKFEIGTGSLLNINKRDYYNTMQGTTSPFIPNEDSADPTKDDMYSELTGSNMPLTNNIYTDKMVAQLLNNVRERNALFDKLSNTYNDLDPWWDKNHRHTQYWDYLQEAKELSIPILDGSGDFLSETWDDVSSKSRNIVEDTYSKVDNWIQSTGLGKMINPDIKKNIDKWMNKLGFTKKKGQGRDIEAFPSNSLLFSNVVKINGIELDPGDFLGYYEEHDYINAKFPLRKIRVKIRPEMKEKGLDLNQIIEHNKMKVELFKNYGYSRSQNHGKFTVTGDALFRQYEVLPRYDGTADISRFKKSDTTKKKDTKKSKSGTTAQAVAADYSNSTEILEITLTSPLNELMTKPKTLMQGVIKEGAKVVDVLNQTFKLHFYGSEAGNAATYIPNSTEKNIMLAMETPEIENDFNTLKTPMDFPAMVKYYHEHSGGLLYNGGYNIFQDHNIIYVLNKKKPNKIEFDDDWSYVLRFGTAEDTGVTQVLYTMSSVSEKTIWIGLLNEDLMHLGDFDIFNERKTGAIFGGVPSIFNASTKGEMQNFSWSTTYIGNAVKTPVDITKVSEFLVRIPNTFCIFRPGDQVKLELSETKEVYTGTIKRWGAQENDEIRAVVLHISMNQGDQFDSENSDINDNPVNKYIKKYQEWTAKTSDKIANKIDEWQTGFREAAQNKIWKEDAEKDASFHSKLLGKLSDDGKIQSNLSIFKNTPYLPQGRPDPFASNGIYNESSWITQEQLIDIYNKHRSNPPSNTSNTNKNNTNSSTKKKKK